MNVIVDPQGNPLPHSARRALAHAWVAAGFKTQAEQEAAWERGYRFARTSAAGERMFEVEIVRTIRVKVRVPAASAEEIRKRVSDPFDSYADDLFHDATPEIEDYRCGTIKPVR